MKVCSIIIVLALWRSYWCGIATITALVDHGFAVNHLTADGSTLLTDLIRPSCTEEELVAVAQLLLDNGADVNIPGFRGMTPIILAAYHQKWALLDLLLERDDISRSEKIDALELAGDIILDNRDGESAPLFPKAFEYWCRSLHLRLGDLDGRVGTSEELFSVMNSLSWLFVTMEHLRRNDDPLLNEATIKTSLEFALATYRFHFDCDQLFDYVSSIIYLTALLAILPHQLMNEENIALLSILVCRDNRRSLLHCACRISQDRPDINRSATIRLLLRVGANPDAADEDGDRPHHFLAWFNPTDEAAACLLLDAGAFLGRLNNGGKTAADLWKENKILDENVDAAATDMPSWLRDYDQVPKLKLQCGRTIRSHQGHYLRLPLSLRNFVEMRPEGNEETSLDPA